LNIALTIIDSGKQPNEIKDALCKAMQVEKLHLFAVLIFLDKKGVSKKDALSIGLYLTLNNLLEKGNE